MIEVFFEKAENTRGGGRKECWFDHYFLLFFPPRCFLFNPLPNNKHLDVTKLKAFEDDKLNINYMTILLFNRLENTVGKGENAGYQHFLLTHSVFQSLFL